MRLIGGSGIRILLEVHVPTARSTYWLVTSALALMETPQLHVAIHNLGNVCSIASN